MEQSIAIKNLCKSYGQTQILKDISFEAKAGRVTAFLGPNGAVAIPNRCPSPNDNFPILDFFL